MTRGWPKGSHLTEEHKQKISESHNKPENWMIHHNVRKRIYLTEEQKAAVHKYLKKIMAVKIGFSMYRLTYYFLDGNVMSGTYFSTNKKLELNIE